MSTPLFDDILKQRLSRRAALRRMASGGLVAGLGNLTPLGSVFMSKAWAAGDPSTLTFLRAEHVIRDDHHLAPGYQAEVLIRWGDKVLKDAPQFDPYNQSAEAQEKQFGYNNDFVAFMPLPLGSTSSNHGLLCVNHEYTNTELMFPGLSRADKLQKLSEEQAEIELAAHGHSVIEIRQRNGRWEVLENSPYARRISLRSTPMRVSGPAAGHERLATNADPSGTRVIGTLNNCAGGVTPWGTVLIAEENFHQYFAGDPNLTDEAENYRRYGLKGKPRYAWGRYFERFNLEAEPNEPNRFGWVVEFDPYDPQSVPVKRTALGRFKHEAATCVVNPDGRVVVYSGDDERFEYLYRFVSESRVNPNSRAANRDLLDKGTLSVARFDADGTLTWLPLIWGQGPLTEDHGFFSQADVLIETRRAADLLGATPMDRPEDVEANPVTGRIYMMLTNNTKRQQPDAANPRVDNSAGHILEMIPPTSAGGVEHGAQSFRWEILLLAGDPNDPQSGARYHEQLNEYGNWLAAPDNCCFDNQGRLWISTDQGSNQSKRGIPDGIYACDLEGAGRALTKFFYAVPRDAEMCGPCFTPDNRTLFVAVQHPGEHKDSSFANPTTRWPDFDPRTPPRPSIVAITRSDGEPIAS